VIEIKDRPMIALEHDLRPNLAILAMLDSFDPRPAIMAALARAAGTALAHA
jgi:hypothetical protein